MTCFKKKLVLLVVPFSVKAYLKKNVLISGGHLFIYFYFIFKNVLFERFLYVQHQCV